MMKLYRCRVCNENGKKETIIHEAANEEALVRYFSGTTLMLISYKETASAVRTAHRARVGGAVVMRFTESMAALLRAGLSVQESLRVCMKIDKSEKNKLLCTELLAALMKGERLHSALELFSPSFPPLYISLVRIGESAGSITDVFARLAAYLAIKKETRQKITQALVYPIAVLITAVCVIACIVFFVFPRLEAVFDVFAENSVQVASSVDSMYRSLMAVAVAAVALLFAAMLAVLLHRFSARARMAIDALLLRLPFFAQYIKTTCTSDFSFSMELLCSSGVPLVQALEQSAHVARNAAYREAVLRAGRDVSQGKLFSESFEKQRVFPDYVVTWIGIGESTGSVQTVFSQLHRYYEKESARIIANITVSAEPAFILLTGILLFVLVGQFVLPVFSLLGAL
ncbi:MAG: type II secretion system F family protein [Treponema sp.]|nr:type II secretion system F family protein [Treponema sp.]